MYIYIYTYYHAAWYAIADTANMAFSSTDHTKSEILEV